MKRKSDPYLPYLLMAHPAHVLKMSAPFCELDFKEKIEYVSTSPFEWSQNLICLAFKNRIVVGIIKFQEEFDEIENEVEFEPVEEFYHGQRVHALSWSSNTSLQKIPKTIEICVASSDFSLRVFASDITTKHRSRKEIQGHSDFINDCAFDLEGDYLASVSDDLTCKIWSVNRQFQLLKSFSLSSPGMCLAWRHEDPGKLLVGEKKGIVRLYNIITLQPLSCIMSGVVPLTGLSTNCQSKVIVILAAGELISADINLISQATDSKMVHPGGGYKVALCPGNDNYVATVGRPGSTLKIINIKSKQTIVTASLENIKGVYALVVETIKHAKVLDRLIELSKLLKKETRLQPWLARILLTELLFGKKELKGESKPVQTVLTYKKQFEKLLQNKKYVPRSKNLTVKKPRYVRINTLHHTPDEIIKIFRKEGWNFIPCPAEYSHFLDVISNLGDDSFTRDFHIKEVLVFSSSVQFYENELYQNRSILLQDKASCLPAFLLQPEPNSVTLDMCAAPGMKTTHLSAVMKGKGKVYATEIDPKRYEVLCSMVTNAGCNNVTSLNMDALKLIQNKPGDNDDLVWTQDVEYILVDPSCSGSGIVERVQIFADEKNDSRRLKKLCSFQFKLLMHALTNFPKAKRVVYSTCSVQHEENEKVVEDVIQRLNNSGGDQRPKFQLVEPLKETWSHRGSDEYEHGKFCLFSNPERDLTNGFFIAVFERVEENEESGLNDSETPKKEIKRKLNGEDNTQENDLNQVPEKRKKKKKKKEVDEAPECLSVSIEANDTILEDGEKVFKKKKHKHRDKTKAKD